MNKYVHVVTDGSVMVLDTSTGEQVKFFSDDARYDTTLNMIRDGVPEQAFTLDVKQVVQNFFSFTEGSDDASVTIKIEDGYGIVVLHDFGDMEVPLQSAITERIIKMSNQGFNSQALVNFVSKLYTNPSKTAIDELYLFIEATGLPITEDGDFIAYKIVKSDYFDIYSGKMRNAVGDAPSMPRALVDTDRNRTCSQGLHFCSKEYLSQYGSSSRTEDRCMLVKINPADVVSIPSDYNNSKGRTWTYKVVGEVESGWRTWLPTKDYTDSAVVSNDGKELPKEVKVEVKPEESVEEDVPSEFFLDGYKDGYKDGRAHLTFEVRGVSDSVPVNQYNDGYDLGYKHGYGHRTKMYK